MRSLWFLVPAHGRVALARACFRQLARTCDELRELGLDAQAVVIADDENLEVAHDAGLWTIERSNEWLGMKWNDGHELAAREGADFVVHFGSDDIIDARTIIALLPEDDEIRAMRRTAVVSEDGTRLARLNIAYDGGDGVRVIPAAMLEPLGFRPCEEFRNRAIDTCVHRQLVEVTGREMKFVYHDLHPLQVVDFKSADGQLNTYTACLDFLEDDEITDPWGVLGEHYPAETLQEIRACYRAEVAA